MDPILARVASLIGAALLRPSLLRRGVVGSMASVACSSVVLMSTFAVPMLAFGLAVSRVLTFVVACAAAFLTLGFLAILNNEENEGRPAHQQLASDLADLASVLNLVTLGLGALLCAAGYFRKLFR